nr:serine hydrolase domain-containing protein [Lysobacter enzymogenes]
MLAPAADAREAATPAGTRIAAQRLARIDAALQRYIDDGRIAGAVALVLQDGKPVYQRAFGWSDKEAGRRMREDTVFRIASQTKALTSAAILMLAEEGRLSLDEPVARTIPAFAKTTVAVAGGEPVAAKRRITVRDLLTHTAGISYGTDAAIKEAYRAQGLGPAAGYGWYTADKDEATCATMERLATLPFVAQPGERWVYGYNTDILGCVVERASGMALDEFVRTRIAEPLGLRDTRFFLPPAQRERLATVYASGDDGRAARADGARPRSLRRRPAPQLRRRRRAAVDRARLRALPGSAAPRRRTRRRAHPLAAQRAADAQQPVRRAVPRRRQGLRLRLRSHRTLRRERARRRGRVRLGRRLRHAVPRGPASAAGDGADDPADAQPHRHPVGVSDVGVPGAGVKAASETLRIRCDAAT